ncbi:MAG: amidohydrolase family protein [Chloroflexi bacterium]|jgi:predicted TIM-barrel fold metal-dependent hydrolase|nr:amidohydrolase family protein [Chloroflexota bacterium]
MDTDIELREELATLPVIDGHEHLRTHDGCTPQTDITDFFLRAYLGSLLPYADTALAARIHDTSRNDRDRWADLTRIWPLVRYTGYGQVMARMLRAWGLSEELEPGSYDIIRAHLQDRSPEMSRGAYQQAHIAGSLTHYLAHPSVGGLANVGDFLAGRLPFDADIHPLLGTLPLHEFYTRADIELLEQVCGVSIGSLEELEKAVEGLIDRCVSLGIVGLKDHAAYTRGLDLGKPCWDAADVELQRLLRGERFDGGARCLSDYLFDRILRAANDHNLPVAIHTGFLVGTADPKANLRHFVSILKAYPTVRFDIYHLNAPWYEDLFAILRSFANTWANCCWAHAMDPAGTVQFLRVALRSIPPNHVIGFGGDFFDSPEPVLAHLDIALDHLAAVLGEAVRSGWMSRSSALEVARLWLYEAPRALYGLFAV